MFSRIVFFSTILAAAACGDEDRPARWSYIHEAIIAPNCTTSSCHSQISAAFGLELHDVNGAYVALTGRGCGDVVEGQPPRGFVAPGDPSRSKLMYLLNGDEVRNMPPDVALPEKDIALIEEWILLGAPCD